LEPVVELRSVSKWYGEVVGLNDVTATIQTGLTGLLGHNGAGKSTLLSLITGQLRPSVGEIRVLGQRPWNNGRVLPRIGYCPEVDAFWRGLTGMEFVTFLARTSGLTRREARAATRRALELTGSLDYADRRLAHCSRGMRQRLKVAQALAHRPELLVLDEPLTGMDPIGRAHLISLFKRLAAEGTRVLVSSHILHEVEALTDNILLLDHGKLIAEGDVRQIRQVMEERSYRIRLQTRQGRPLAALLVPKDYVAGLEIQDREALIVHTHDPDRLLRELPALLTDHRIHCTEITSSGESLESIFGYLTGGTL